VLVLLAATALAAMIAAAQTTTEEGSAKLASVTQQNQLTSNSTGDTSGSVKIYSPSGNEIVKSVSIAGTTNGLVAGNTRQTCKADGEARIVPVALPALLKPQPKPQPKPQVFKIAGHEYVKTEWHSAEASWYGEGSKTAWANGRWSQERWDSDTGSWVSEPRVKLYHFEWMGFKRWDHYKEYKDSIPTVAHLHHEFGTFVIFVYNGGPAVIAMVTDRGPYHPTRKWDLNPCLKRKLGFGDVGTVTYNVLKKIN